MILWDYLETETEISLHLCFSCDLYADPPNGTPEINMKLGTMLL